MCASVHSLFCLCGWKYFLIANKHFLLLLSSSVNECDYKHPKPHNQWDTFDFPPHFLIRRDLHGNLWLIKHFPPPSRQNKWDDITVYVSAKHAPKCKISRESLLTICKVTELIQPGILLQNEVLFVTKSCPVPRSGSVIHTIPICRGALASTAMELWGNSSKGRQGGTSPTVLPLCMTERVFIMGPASQANRVHHVIRRETVRSSSSKINSSTQLALRIRHQNWTNGPWEENTVSWLGLVL